MFSPFIRVEGKNTLNHGDEKIVGEILNFIGQLWVISKMMQYVMRFF
jgi:hypothetical protein